MAQPEQAPGCRADRTQRDQRPSPANVKSREKRARLRRGRQPLIHQVPVGDRGASKHIRASAPAGDRNRSGTATSAAWGFVGRTGGMSTGTPTILQHLQICKRPGRKATKAWE